MFVNLLKLNLISKCTLLKCSDSSKYTYLNIYIFDFHGKKSHVYNRYGLDLRGLK